MITSKRMKEFIILMMIISKRDFTTSYELRSGQIDKAFFADV
jgi:hypothetical protein